MEGRGLARSIMAKLKKKNLLYGKRRVATHPALQSIGVESELVPLLLHPLQLQLVLLDLLLEHSM